MNYCSYFYLLIVAFCCQKVVVQSKKKRDQQGVEKIKATDFVDDKYIPVPCLTKYESNDPAHLDFPCGTENCGRRILDGLFPIEDIETLHEIVNKGMATRVALGGPTILDINTGYIRDSGGLDNLFFNDNGVYTEDDFAHYGRIINKLRQTVMDTFGIEELYFTAPTFITRLDGDEDWSPQSMHDEYWHPHADHNNTEHYHYSGLLYMSSFGQDFTGGRLNFLRPSFPLFSEEIEENEVGEDGTKVQTQKKMNTPKSSDIELQVQPRAGRTIIFTAGHENTHYVEKVTSGQRFVLSFWFTCDKDKEFEIFLDGKAHIAFSKQFKKVHEEHRKRSN